MPESTPRTRLASLFTQHAVLQAEQICPVWGWDEPGRIVTLRLAPHVVAVRADDSGQFRFDLPPTAAGGPHRLSIEGSTSIVLEDVWFGEVWLASGQSNMEWPLAAAHDGAKEAAAARWPQIRTFKVEPRASLEQETECRGRWTVCTPESAGDFSAVGYFFAREIHWAREAAVGIVDATWGGTAIEAWMSLPTLAPRVPDLEARRARLRAELERLPELALDYERAVVAWQKSNLPADTGNQGFEQGWADLAFDDSTWPSLELPAFWQSQGMAFNGVVWFRRMIELPSAWADRDLVLHLGAVDDFDDTYFDGVLVGRTPPGTLDSHRLRRRYPIPGERARAGRHVLAVRVFDHFGDGGFAGPAGEMALECPALGERIPLRGAWRALAERQIPLVPMRIFETFPTPPLALAQQHAPAALFNGMLAPLIGYALRGALWYQGESNVERAASYRALLVAFLRDLRTRWGQGQFPFYYVQLANFSASSDWPLLREAQAEAAIEPETGMVVTFDIGDESDIHPTNKQEVGRRLALWARACTYGESSLAHQGPTLERVRIEGSIARVRFAHADGLGTSDGEPPRGFTLAGPDGQHRPASAHIEGTDVVLSSPQVPSPRAVRYAFADTLPVNLCNTAGLPAAPFRTDS